MDRLTLPNNLLFCTFILVYSSHVFHGSSSKNSRFYSSRMNRSQTERWWVLPLTCTWVTGNYVMYCNVILHCECGGHSQLLTCNISNLWTHRIWILIQFFCEFLGVSHVPSFSCFSVPPKSPKWSCFMLFLLALAHPAPSFRPQQPDRWRTTRWAHPHVSLRSGCPLQSAVNQRFHTPYVSRFQILKESWSWNNLINKLINLTIHVVLLRPYTCFFTCPDSVLGVPLSDPWHHAGFGPQSIEHIRSCLCTSAWNAKGRTCDFGRFASYLIIHVYSSKSRTSEIMGLFNDV